MIKNKLNIAIFHLAFIYSGGGEKLVLQEYDGLKKLGHSVSIFSTVVNYKKCFPDIIKKYKIKTFLPEWSIFKGHEAFKTILSCLTVPFYAYRFRKYDVIFACNQPSLWIAFLIKLFYGIKYVSYLAQPTRFLHPRAIDKKTGLFFEKHSSDSISARLMMTNFRKFSNWADRLSIKGSSRILVNGDYMKRVIEKTYKVRVVNCPSGANLPKKINFKRENFILVTNRHFPQKRIEYAIFVLNSILATRPNYKLIITGMNTDYTCELQKLASELGIEKSIDFRGYVNDLTLKKLYSKANCYLYTAPEEDFGMGIIEAMSFGATVVAWNATGPSKIVLNGIDGLLAKPYEIMDFTRLTQKVIDNKSFAKRISQNARKKIIDLFSMKRHIDTIDKALKTVVSLNDNEKAF